MSKDIEAMLEKVWLDGAQLAGGAYLGKKTMRVPDALAAIEAHIQEREGKLLLEFVSCITDYAIKPAGLNDSYISLRLIESELAALTSQPKTEEPTHEDS